MSLIRIQRNGRSGRVRVTADWLATATARTGQTPTACIEAVRQAATLLDDTTLPPGTFSAFARRDALARLTAAN